MVGLYVRIGHFVQGFRAPGPAEGSRRGIRLIGVDVPSVDPLDDKELAAHHQLFKHGIHILENVVLD
ncbi:hypothetical protein ACFVGO_10300, partial [Kitasatospora sp. NPDC057738]